MISKYHYHCETCGHDFDTGKTVTDGIGRKNEVCPECGSRDYGLTNLSWTKLDNGLCIINYDSPSAGMIIFSTFDENEANRAINRYWNLKWDAFKELITAEQIYAETRQYLDNMPCMLNNYITYSASGSDPADLADLEGLQIKSFPSETGISLKQLRDYVENWIGMIKSNKHLKENNRLNAERIKVLENICYALSSFYSMSGETSDYKVN